MNIKYKGNFISIDISANEGQQFFIMLKDGYSFEEVYIVSVSNITFHDNMKINKGDILKFPPVNAKSPSIIKPVVTDVTKSATLQFLITKFGRIPDFNYFDNAFTPILVNGVDGNMYNVIPSDQFK